MDLYHVLLIVVGLIVVPLIGYAVNILFRLWDKDDYCPQCGRSFKVFGFYVDGRCRICHREQAEAFEFIGNWDEDIWDGIPPSDPSFLCTIE